MALEGTQSKVLKQFGVSYPRLVDYYSTQQAATLVQVCTLVLVIWDYTITLDSEIAFFWQAKRQLRWSVARMLFMLNRYFPIVAFSLHVYWRVNRSIDNPVKQFGTPVYSTHNVKMHHAEEYAPSHNLLQVLRVWSLYRRSRSVGLFLLALLVCGGIGVFLARALPTPEGYPLPQLAPESLTRCGREIPTRVFERIPGVLVETVLLSMTFLNVWKSWTRVGALPLFQALLVDGATVYVVLILTFGLDIFASTNSKLYYPIVDTHFPMSLGVITCNHLILSLREVRDRPISMAPLSTFSRQTNNKEFAPQASNITHTYTNQSKMISLHQRDISTDWDLQQENLAPERALWHETPPSGGSTPQRAFEMD